MAAFTIPVKVGLSRQATVEKTSMLADKLKPFATSDKHILADKKYLSVLQRVSAVYKEAGSPLLRIEKGLHPWVSFGIMPLFALANGGITIRSEMIGAFSDPLFTGIIIGLCLGKPFGIISVCWILERMGWAGRPAQMSWRTLWAGGCFAGIGFTMSIFIAGMAFNPATGLEEAKLAILLASTLSTFLGILLLSH